MDSSGSRARLIKLIHVAKRDLSIDDETYRAIVADKSKGKACSAKDLTVRQLESVLSHMQDKGFRIRMPASKSVERPLDQSLDSRKIRALWLQLAVIGAVRDPSELALAAYVRRIARVDDLRWVSSDKAELLIETLKKWAERVWPEAIKQRWARLNAAGLVGGYSPVAASMVCLAWCGSDVDATKYQGLHTVWAYLDTIEKGAAENERADL